MLPRPKTEYKFQLTTSLAECKILTARSMVVNSIPKLFPRSTRTCSTRNQNVIFMLRKPEIQLDFSRRSREPTRYSPRMPPSETRPPAYVRENWSSRYIGRKQQHLARADQEEFDCYIKNYLCDVALLNLAKYATMHSKPWTEIEN